MKRLLLKKGIITSAFALGAVTMSFAAHLGDKLTFSARMDGAQEVPAVTTNGKGVATFTLNPTRDTLCMTMFSSGLSEEMGGIHLHEGAFGATGGVLVDLTPYLINGNIEAVITGALLTPSLIQSMVEGNVYLNGHTASNPNGEIRGQVKLESDFAYRGLLNGMKEVPSNMATATGLGLFNLSLDKGKMTYSIVANDLTGPITGAHIHFGDDMTAGGVAANLSDSISGNTIQGSLDVSALGAGFIDSLEAGKVYINVHTDANPAGEIRSQLDFDAEVGFDAFLNTTQSVPAPMGANGTGTAYFSLNSTFDVLRYEVQVDGLTGPITSAHLHNAVAGQTGGVLVDLSGDIIGNRISGTITGAALTSELIGEMLESAVYINVHTDMNPNGEIRGQVNRVAREGYTIIMDGAQEVPAVSTTANGGGIITIGRDRDNVHVMLVAKDLSGTVGGAHLHNAAAGSNGGVMFDLTPLFSSTANYDAAFGYLTAEDASPFLKSDEVLFRNNEVYVNLHTAANPDGEIRGQVLRGSQCNNRALGINENTISSTVSVYPNPASDKIQVTLDNVSNGTEVAVYDLFGKKVRSTIVTNSNAIVEVSDLKAGVYLVKVAGANGTRFVKL